MTPTRAPVDARDIARTPAWLDLKAAVLLLRERQGPDGAVPDPADHPVARELVTRIAGDIRDLAPAFPHDAAYLAALVTDAERWADSGFGIPDFHDSVVEFHPEAHRRDGVRHLVVFPMFTQNGSTERLMEALLIEVVWPDFVAAIEEDRFDNALFVPIRFLDFTPGYDTDSAVLFPETVAMRTVPRFT